VIPVLLVSAVEWDVEPASVLECFLPLGSGL